MSFQYLLHTERADELARRYGEAATICDQTRSRLAPVAVEADVLLARDTGAVLGDLAMLGEALGDDERDLTARVRMVLLGGAAVNSGLWALDVVERHFTTFDTGRDGPSATADGIVSVEDLEALAATRSGEVAAAAAFLLANPAILAAVDDAEGNDGYLDDIAEGRFAHGNGDGKFDIGDIDAYRRKLSDWATLLAFLPAADTAAKGGSPDGFVSEGDLEALVDDATAPPELREAAARVAADGAFHRRPVDWGKIGVELLDAASFVPVIGDGVDVGRAIWYATQGDWVSAAIHAAGVVPIPGVSSSELKRLLDTVDTFRRVAVQNGSGAALTYASHEAARALAAYAATELATNAAGPVGDHRLTTKVLGEAAAVASRRHSGG